MGNPSPPQATHPSAPPLWVWIAAIAVALILVLISIPPFLSYSANHRDPFYPACLRRIENLNVPANTPHDRMLRTVAVGSSLLRCAAFDNTQMEEFAQDKGFGALRFVRLTRNSGEIRHFQPLLDDIIAAKPDILLIHADMLLYRRQGKGLDFVLEYNEYIKHLLLRGLSKLTGRPVGLGRENNPHGLLDTEPPPAGTEMPGANSGAENHRPQGAGSRRELLAYLNTFARRKSLGSMDPADPVVAALRRAHEQGIRIVLLVIPRTWEVEQSIPFAQRRHAQVLLHQAETLFGARVLTFGRRLGNDFYGDFAHLNEKGRLEFSNWLLPRLFELVREGNG
jgi:hypothetical protein